jgi:hypothetical protein
MPDQTITCSDCKADFVFSEGEQKFFASKGLSIPKRCKPCRQARKESKQDQKGMEASR